MPAKARVNIQSSKKVDRRTVPGVNLITNACGDDMEEAFFNKEQQELFSDSRTLITASRLRELPRLRLSKNPELIYDARKMLDPLGDYELYRHYGRVLAMKVHVHSLQLGDWDTNLVYVIGENSAFAMDFLLHNHIAADYIYRAHYGYRFCPDAAGSRSSGHFLLKLLEPLQTRYFMTDEDWDDIRAADPAEILYGRELNLCGNPCLTRIISIPVHYPNRYYEYGIGLYRVEEVSTQGEPADLCGRPLNPKQQTEYMFVRVNSVWGPRMSRPLSMTECLQRMLQYGCEIYRVRTLTEFIRLFPLDMMPFPVYIRSEESSFIDRAEQDYNFERMIVLEDGSCLCVRKKWEYEDFMKLLTRLQTLGLVAIPNWRG